MIHFFELILQVPDGRREESKVDRSGVTGQQVELRLFTKNGAVTTEHGGRNLFPRHHSMLRSRSGLTPASSLLDTR
jgi:hypothetical protein